MENMEMLIEPVRASLHQVGEFLPRVLLAIGIVVVGWLVAKAVRFAIVKMLRAINFNVVTEKAGIDTFLQQGGSEINATSVLGLLSYWLVILAALLIAFNSMGLTYVTDLIGRIVLFVPKVMVAVLILAFGAYFARFIGLAVTTYCKNVGIADAQALGKVAQYAILVFVVADRARSAGPGRNHPADVPDHHRRRCAGAGAGVRPRRPETRGRISRTLVTRQERRQERVRAQAAGALTLGRTCAGRRGAGSAFSAAPPERTSTPCTRPAT